MIKCSYDIQQYGLFKQTEGVNEKDFKGVAITSC